MSSPPPEATPPASRRHALRREELAGQKISALRKLAAEVGANEDELENADDTDDTRTALVDLIVSKNPAESPGLREELEATKEREPLRGRGRSGRSLAQKNA